MVDILLTLKRVLGLDLSLSVRSTYVSNFLSYDKTPSMCELNLSLSKNGLAEILQTMDKYLKAGRN